MQGPTPPAYKQIAAKALECVHGLYRWPTLPEPRSAGSDSHELSNDTWRPTPSTFRLHRRRLFFLSSVRNACPDGNRIRDRHGDGSVRCQRLLAASGALVFSRPDTVSLARCIRRDIYLCARCPCLGRPRWGRDGTPVLRRHCPYSTDCKHAALFSSGAADYRSADNKRTSENR